MNIDDFRQLPIMGIVRGVREDQIEKLASAVTDSGLKTIEIAINAGDGPALIKKLVNAARGSLTIGAGTVLDVESVKKVIDAGATFIVSPVFIPEVVEYCASHSIPVFPGALTPTEIYRAWQGGATMVKVFPAKIMGPGYLKEIKGPFRDISLLACGGVSVQTIGDYFANKASAVAFGGSIIKTEWLEAGHYDKISSGIKDLLTAYRNCL